MAQTKLPTDQSASAACQTEPTRGTAEDQAWLEGALSDADHGRTKLRCHGWRLLQEVIGQPTANGLPTWMTWSTKCSTPSMNLLLNCDEIRHSSTALSPVLLSATQPFQLLAVGPTNSAPGASSDNLLPTANLASVFYNPDAVQSIVTNKLGLPSGSVARRSTGLDGLLTAYKTTGAVPSFDSRSLVIKSIWEVVERENDKSDEATIQVFDNEHRPDTENNSYGRVDAWNTFLYVDLQKTGCPSSADPNEAVEYKLKQHIPLGCFVYVPVGPQDADEADRVDGVNPPASPSYYLVLVGIHIASKEVPDWSWNTFWWTNRPSKDASHAEGLPTTLPIQYKYFVMDTTLTGAAGKPLQDSPSCFNPYLEGTKNGGISTNCAYCHSLAADRVGHDLDPHILMGGKPPVFRAANELEGAVTTDFIWSIATARDDNQPQLLNETLSGLRATARQNTRNGAAKPTQIPQK